MAARRPESRRTGRQEFITGRTGGRSSPQVRPRETAARARRPWVVILRPPGPDRPVWHGNWPAEYRQLARRVVSYVT